MKHTILIILLSALAVCSPAVSDLPHFRADFANGKFKDFKAVSGKWEITRNGLREFSDDSGADSVTRTDRIHFGPNTALTIAAQPGDGQGTTWIDFGISEGGNGFRLIHESGTAVQVSLYRIRAGKLQLLASADNTDFPIDAGNKKKLLEFRISSSADAVQVKLNDVGLFCVRCPDMPSGGVALGVRGRKQTFRLVKAQTYRNMTLTMQPSEIRELEFMIRQKALRHSFYRDENPILQIGFANRSTAKAAVGQIQAILPDGTKVPLQKAEIEAGKEHLWDLPLKGADYEGACKVRVQGKVKGRDLQSEYELFFANRPAADSYVLASWNGSPQPSFLDFLHRNGVNGSALSFSPYADFEKARKVTALVNDIAIRNRMVMKATFPVLTNVDPSRKNLCSVLPNGKYARILNFNLPEAQAYAIGRSEALAAFLLDYPAFRSVLLTSEVENHLTLSCAPEDMKRYEKLFGQPIPKLEEKAAVIDNTDGVVLKLPEKIKKTTPAIVSTDNVWYNWMTFLWKKGFGDNLLHAKISDAMKKINPNLETEHDPFRNYPVFDRNIGLDFYGTWFYPTPDAGESFMAIESMLAAIAGGGNKQKMQFGASMWLYNYNFCRARSRQAGVQPENIYLETMFLGLAARPDKYDLFSFTFLLPDSPMEYREKTLLPNLKNFSEKMAAPIWSATRGMKRENRPVSMLLSSAGQIFGAQRWGGYGYCLENGMLNLLWKANLPSNIIFEDTIRQNHDWKKCKLLVIASAGHLPEDIYREICDYAKKGGKILACSPFDKLIPGAETLDINFDFTVKASYYHLQHGSQWTALKAQEYRLEQAHKLRAKYRSLISTFADSDSVEIYLRTLQDTDTRFVFALNDRRTEGSHMGKKFHAVLDSGVGQSASVRLNRETGTVYEFPAGKQLTTSVKKGNQVVNLTFAPSEGKILLCYPEALGKLSITAKKNYVAKISLTNSSGKAFRGTVPVRICWTDPAGTPRMEYNAIRNGKLETFVRPGKNIRKGIWKCQVTELASGMSAEALF